jgi:tripeptide aminopeptidase
MNGRCVCPGIRSDYKGDAIVLDKKNKIILDPKIFPELLHYKGQTIIHTDGSTLLGADDKAGIAEIMTAIQFLLTHPEIKHGAICIAFTPDEEIGTGIDHFNVNAFGADYAYTVDGGGIGELEYENFNAAIADIHIEGVDIHPGEAKGKMINALHVAHRIEAMFPQDQKPEYTQDYEGFFLLTQLNGTVGQANMQYIIRDHDKQKFEDKKKYLSAVVRQMNMDYRPNMVSCKIRDQYYNMKEKIEEVPFMITIAEEAMREADVVPIIKPIRGGTDGARLSFRGLPCPNLFTGGHNFHGKYEFIPLESMEKATLTIINLIQKYARRIENF